MDAAEDPGYDDYTVFAGSSEHDVMCSRIFWNSVTLQPPLESRLVSGDVEQRLRAAREAKTRKNDTQQELEELNTVFFIGSTESARYRTTVHLYGKMDTNLSWFCALDTRQVYCTVTSPEPVCPSYDQITKGFLQGDSRINGRQDQAKRREEIIALLIKQREDRIKKELVSFGHKPSIHIEGQRSPALDVEAIEDIEAVRQLD